MTDRYSVIPLIGLRGRIVENDKDGIGYGNFW